MVPDATSPFQPEPQPPVFNDSLETTPNETSFPVETTRSATEVAVDNGIDVGEETLVDAESPVDPDERTDLEGPDVLPEGDGTLFHPSFGAGVRLNLGMGTGAGEEEDPSEPLVDLDPNDSVEIGDEDDDSEGLKYVPDANGN